MHRGYISFFVLTFAATSNAFAERNVFLEADFETGAIQSSSKTQDAFFVMTLPEPQPPGTCEFHSPEGVGGFDATSATDLRVVKSETWAAEGVLPRAGDYFVRNSIDRNKCYPNDRPRSHFVMTTPLQEYTWDEEVWIGFSLFIPSSWEHDNSYKALHTAHLSGISFFSTNASASSSHVSLRINSSADSAVNEWALRMVSPDATSVTETDVYNHSLGSIADDLGKWTDFVFRIRWNPFTRRTNPAQEGIVGARNQWYEGNRGILQIWKSTGEVDQDGNRDLELIFSRVNEPLGLVPREDRGLRVVFDMYKYGWQAFDTDPVGPIFVGFDEIRYGRTSREGTGFDDVVPGASSATQVSDLARPEAPVLLSLN